MDTPTRILNETRALFKRRGIRAVTMDDIARELGMSKKTVYQYFKNKAEIVQAVCNDHFNEERCILEEILEKAHDPVEEMLLILQAMEKTFKEFPTVMIYEVQRYYPNAWNLFDGFKHDFILQSIRQNLNEGVKLGLYRQDMDLELVARLRLTEIEMIMNPEVFPPRENDIQKLQMELFKIFLHGVVTMRGKKLIYKYLNQPEDE